MGHFAEKQYTDILQECVGAERYRQYMEQTKELKQITGIGMDAGTGPASHFYMYLLAKTDMTAEQVLNIGTTEREKVTELLDRFVRDTKALAGKSEEERAAYFGEIQGKTFEKIGAYRYPDTDLPLGKKLGEIGRQIQVMGILVNDATEDLKPYTEGAKKQYATQFYEAAGGKDTLDEKISRIEPVTKQLAPVAEQLEKSPQETAAVAARPEERAGLRYILHLIWDWIRGKKLEDNMLTSSQVQQMTETGKNLTRNRAEDYLEKGGEFPWKEELDEHIKKIVSDMSRTAEPEKTEEKTAAVEEKPAEKVPEKEADKPVEKGPEQAAEAEKPTEKAPEAPAQKPAEKAPEAAEKPAEKAPGEGTKFLASLCGVEPEALKDPDQLRRQTARIHIGGMAVPRYYRLKDDLFMIVPETTEELGNRLKTLLENGYRNPNPYSAAFLSVEDKDGMLQPVKCEPGDKEKAAQVSLAQQYNRGNEAQCRQINAERMRGPKYTEQEKLIIDIAEEYYDNGKYSFKRIWDWEPSIQQYFGIEDYRAIAKLCAIPEDITGYGAQREYVIDWLRDFRNPEKRKGMIKEAADRLNAIMPEKTEGAEAEPAKEEPATAKTGEGLTYLASIAGVDAVTLSDPETFRRVTGSIYINGVVASAYLEKTDPEFELSPANAEALGSKIKGLVDAGYSSPYSSAFISVEDEKGMLNPVKCVPPDPENEAQKLVAERYNNRNAAQCEQNNLDRMKALESVEKTSKAPEAPRTKEDIQQATIAEAVKLNEGAELQDKQHKRVGMAGLMADTQWKSAKPDYAALRAKKQAEKSAQEQLDGKSAEKPKTGFRIGGHRM